MILTVPPQAARSATLSRTKMKRRKKRRKRSLMEKGKSLDNEFFSGYITLVCFKKEKD